MAVFEMDQMTWHGALFRDPRSWCQPALKEVRQALHIVDIRDCSP